MAPDYDLSNLQTSEVDVWIHLLIDTILDQIRADQAGRLGFTLAFGDCIVSAATEEPQAILDSEGADHRARLRKHNEGD